jgi:hypothetical protein
MRELKGLQIVHKSINRQITQKVAILQKGLSE